MPEVIQNENLDLGLCAHVLGPVVHGRQQRTQGREKRLAGLFELVAVWLADVVLEEHLEKDVFVIAQPLFCRTPLLSIEAVGQLD